MLENLHTESIDGIGVTGSTHLHPHTFVAVEFLMIRWALSSFVML